MSNAAAILAAGARRLLLQVSATGLLLSMVLVPTLAAQGQGQGNGSGSGSGGGGGITPLAGGGGGSPYDVDVSTKFAPATRSRNTQDHDDQFIVKNKRDIHGRV